MGATQAGSKASGARAPRSQPTGRRQAQASIEAEQAVLSSILVIPDAIYDAEVVDRLAPEDFSDRRHQAVYGAILACEAESKPFWDLVVLAETLRKAGDLDRIGGIDFLESLLAAPGEASSLKAHVEIVSEKSLLRRISRAGQKMIEASSAPDADGAEVLEEAEQAVFKLGERGDVEKFIYMAESLPMLDEYLAAGINDDLVGVSTGFPTLDQLTSGWQAGQLVVIAGRPGMGKSAVALQMARHAAEVSGGYVLVVSYEMTKMELLTRMVSGAVEMGVREIRRGKFTAEQVKALSDERARLAQLPLGINDRPPMTISGLRSSLRREARRKPLAMVVVDYIQLMSGSGKENRTQDVTEISRGLKLLAGELGVPILGLSQLNRGVEVRGTDNYRPRLSDLRDSGSIEQDADVVLFVNRPVIINPAFQADYAELVIAKQRAGEAGAIVECEFKSKYTKFIDKGLLKSGIGGVGGSTKAPF